jgi:hypothetical protein
MPSTAPPIEGTERHRPKRYLHLIVWHALILVGSRAPAPGAGIIAARLSTIGKIIAGFAMISELDPENETVG